MTVTAAETQHDDQSWDIGLLVIGINVMPNYAFTETIYYGQSSTASSVASQISSAFSANYAQNGLSVSVSGATVTFTLSDGASFGILNVSGPDTSFQLNGSDFGSTYWSPPANTGNTINTTVYMTGGTDSGTFYDVGTLAAHVSGVTASVDWAHGSTASSLASELASALNTVAGFLSASASGGTITLTSVGRGPADDFSVLANVTNFNAAYFSSPSFSVSSTNMSGGAASENTLYYGFTIPEHVGYDVNGNVLSSWDSVMGSWSYGHDNLNRLVSVSATGSGQANFTGAVPTWTYDAFGNRTAKTWGGSGDYTVLASTSATFSPGIN